MPIQKISIIATSGNRPSDISISCQTLWQLDKPFLKYSLVCCSMYLLVCMVCIGMYDMYLMVSACVACIACIVRIGMYGMYGMYLYVLYVLNILLCSRMYLLVYKNTYQYMPIHANTKNLYNCYQWESTQRHFNFMSNAVPTRQTISEIFTCLLKYIIPC